MTMMRKEVDPFIFLPDDILSDTLKRLPDAVLRYKAKYVCRRWFHIITNDILLDDASFILQNSRGTSKARLVGVREEQQGLHLKEQTLDIPFTKIKSWYNEFLLIMDQFYSREKSLYIFNLITKERSYLPECHTNCRPHFTHKCGVALYFDGVKGVYKVVHIYMGPPIQCHILILGSEIVSGVSSNWKKMEVPWHMEDWGYCLKNPISVQIQGRYFHWGLHNSNYLVSVDMEKEEIFKTSLPGSDDHTCNYHSIFEMGGFLGLIGGFSSDKADIWILKDFEKMKWDKLHSMTVSNYFIENYPVTCFLSPICGVISKRYIIFERRSGKCCSYDLKDRVVKELNIHNEYGDPYVVCSSAPSFM